MHGLMSNIHASATGALQIISFFLKWWRHCWRFWLATSQSNAICALIVNLSDVCHVLSFIKRINFPESFCKRNPKNVFPRGSSVRERRDAALVFILSSTTWFFIVSSPPSVPDICASCWLFSLGVGIKDSSGAGVVLRRRFLLSRLLFLLDLRCWIPALRVVFMPDFLHLTEIFRRVEFPSQPSSAFPSSERGFAMKTQRNSILINYNSIILTDWVVHF